MPLYLEKNNQQQICVMTLQLIIFHIITEFSKNVRGFYSFIVIFKIMEQKAGYHLDYSY